MPAPRSFAALPVRLRFLTVLTGVFAAAVMSGDAGAATKTWTGSTSSDWSIPSNWSPLGAPGSSDSVVFPTVSNRSINLSGNRAVADVTFGSSGPYRLLDNLLTITSGDITSALANHRIDSSLVLGGEGAWNITSGKLSVYGSVNSTTGNTFGIDKTGAGTLEFLNVGATNILKNYLHEAGTAEFYEGTYTLTSTTFDAFSAMYMAEGTVTVSHRAKLKGTSTGNLVLQSGGAGSSNMIIRDADTEVATFGQLFLGASGTSGNSLTVTNSAKVRDIGLFVAGFNGNATVTVANQATVNSNGMAVGMLTGVSSTLTVVDPSSALTTNFLALGGYNSAQKGGTGTATIRDRASLAVSGELRFFSSASSLTVDAASASIGALTNEPGVVGSIRIRNDGGTAALTLTSPVSMGAPGPFTFDGVISNAPGGAGGIVKQGPGEQIFTKQQTYTGGTRIEGGTLRLTFNGDDALAPTGSVTAAGGMLSLNGRVQHTGQLTMAGGAITGAAGGLLLPSSAVLQAGELSVPTQLVTAAVKTTAGTLTVNATLSAPAITVTSGTLALNQGATAATTAVNGGTLQLRGSVSGNLQSTAGGALTITGLTAISGTTSLVGSMNVGSHTVVSGSTQAMSVASVSMGGGTIVSPAGINLSSGVVGNGTILAPIYGGSTAAITAIGGALSLGSANAEDGFTDFDGLLFVNDNQVNLLSEQTAELGSSTSIAGGTLSSLHGINLAAGRTVFGNGTVQGPFVNQGDVTGGPGSSVLKFGGPVSGAGSFAGNVEFLNTYSPGASPASVALQNVAFGENSQLKLELGGATQGTLYDHLAVSGALALDGALSVSLIDEFTPNIGQSFNLFDWGSRTGQFDTLSLPALAAGAMWDVSQLYTTGVLSVASLYAADFDSNGRVDAADLALWRSGFGSTGVGRAAGDATGDGSVTGDDFLVWQRQLGSGVTAVPTATPIPEPAALTLLAACGLALAAHSRRRHA